MQPLAYSADLQAALTHLTAALRDETPGTTRLNGVIHISLAPDKSLIRLSPATTTLRQQLLQARLAGCLRQDDTIHHINPGEWVVILPSIRTPAVLTLAMLKLRRVLEESVLVVEGLEWHPRIVCGAALAPDDGHDPLHLIHSARITSNYALAQGENDLRFCAWMDRADVHQAQIDHAVHVALNNGKGFQLFLQPKVRVSDGVCDGAEALLRWYSEELGWLSPPDVIATVERLGLRKQFNRWLFHGVSSVLAELRESQVNIQVSLNLQSVDLRDPEVPELLLHALQTRRLDPASVQVEITETGMLENSEVVSQVLDLLTQAGITISIDDFGTGFATMSYLRDLPLREVKIDQSFVRAIDSSHHNREIVTSVIELAHRLDLDVTAEGVESPAAGAIIAELGCDRIQGYLHSLALPPRGFINWYKQHNASANRQD